MVSAAGDSVYAKFSESQCYNSTFLLFLPSRCNDSVSFLFCPFVFFLRLRTK